MPQYTPLWTSILRSPKVFALDPEAFRLWVLLLALAQEHDRLGGNLPGVDSVAFTLHMTLAEIRRLTTLLIDAGFLDESPDGGLMIHDWREWRRKEDHTSAARKRRQRDKERHDASRQNNSVTPVTRDISPERDRTVTSVTDDAKPLRIARKGMDSQPFNAKSIQIRDDVTDVTDVTQSHAYRTVHTEQNTLPQTPSPGAGPIDRPEAPPDLEPFEAPPEAPGIRDELPAAARALADHAGTIWGAGGHDWALELLRTFDAEVVRYGAKETRRMLNGRPFNPGSARYWERTCQNHRDGIPPDPPPGQKPPGRGSPSTPITFTAPPTDLTKIYHPSKLARMGLGANDASLDDLRRRVDGTEARPGP